MVEQLRGSETAEAAPSPVGGSLKATILSCYDLPHDAQPSSVVLELLGSAGESIE
jgi:hypothetical protein